MERKCRSSTILFSMDLQAEQYVTGHRMVPWPMRPADSSCALPLMC